jgi:hypothetical protein
MAKPNFGFKGDGITATNAMAAGATVTTGTYVYLTQLSAVTPSTTYPPMASDPGAQTALFSSPNALWTSVFGATTSSSGYAATPYVGTSSSWSGVADITVAVMGTLRITGTLSADDQFSLTYLGSNAQVNSVGDYNGFSNQAINWTVSNASGPYRLNGSNVLSSNLTIWLVPS